MPVVDDEEIHKLLVNNHITLISVDTNIFDKKALKFNETSLRALSNLKNGSCKLVLTDTIAREVLAHIGDSMTEALQTAKTGIGKALAAFETMEPRREDLLHLITGGLSANEAAQQRWKDFVDSTGCEVLNDTALVSASKLFDDYFCSKPPFGSGKKKSEFPDALALNALEREAENRDTNILVVSGDGGWSDFCEGSKSLYLVTEIERALSLITAAPERLRAAVIEWLFDLEGGMFDIGSMVYEAAKDMEFSVDASPERGEVELFAWLPQVDTIKWPDKSDIDIIDIGSSERAGGQQVLLSIPIELDVRIPIDARFSIWDGVDKEYLDMGARLIESRQKLQERLTVALFVERLAYDDQNIEVLGVGFEPVRRHIYLGGIDMFEPEDYDRDINY